MGKTNNKDNTFSLNTMMLRNIKERYQPGLHLALDEMLRKFFGRYEFKHRLSSKPAKKGLKTFLIACSRLRIPFDSVFHDNKMLKTPGLSLVAGMVFDIRRRNKEAGFIKEGTTIFLDNYFTTQGLFKKCFEIGIFVVGTVKTNVLPAGVYTLSEEFRKQNKRHYDTVYDVVRCPSFTVKYDDIFYIIIWDNNLFCIGTNNKEYVDMGLVHVNTYYNKKQRAELGHDVSYKCQTEIPWIVRLYNFNMNSVDIIDQVISSYDRHQRHGVWKLQVYNSSLQMMEVVAYQMHLTYCKSINKSPLSHLKFKEDLALSLFLFRLTRQMTNMSSNLSSDIHPIDNN